MALDAVIFDVDGTLIDTNALHVEAFRRAFADHGYTISADRITVEIGKGGDQLVPAIVGAEADARDGKAIRGDQPKRFAELARAQGLAVFPQAQALLAAVRRRGLRVVIATSSGQAQIDSIERYGRWAFTADADVVVKADDAAASKPAPDLVASAVAQSGLSPAQCVMIGDTPYDAVSARDAGVVTLGVTCGGNAADVLLAAGARHVYRDPADLLDRLADALHAASPGAAHLTRSTLEFLMGEALTVAADALAAGRVPVGAVVARGDGSVVARAAGRAGPLSPAGLLAMRDAGELRDAVLVTTVEPCVTTVAAAMMAAVDTAVYGPASPADGGVRRVTPPTVAGARTPRFVGDVRSADAVDLLRRWLDKHPGDGPDAEYARSVVTAAD